MNKEIELESLLGMFEMLKDTKDGSIELSKRETDLLLNYITNLQDTLKDREEYCYGLETELTNLQEELKSANESITWWQNRFNAIQQENERLKDIIKEAINYIDDNTYYKDHKGHINIDDVYIILQGSDKQ